MYNIVKIDKTKGKVATGVNLATLRDGTALFQGNTNITNWTADMPNLENAHGMFYSSSITSFKGNLKNLKEGRGMFGSTKLSNFSSDLSSLTRRNYNVYFNTVKKLEYETPKLIKCNAYAPRKSVDKIC